MYSKVSWPAWHDLSNVDLAVKLQTIGNKFFTIRVDLFQEGSIRSVKWLVLLSLDHNVPGLNPAGSEFFS